MIPFRANLHRLISSYVDARIARDAEKSHDLMLALDAAVGGCIDPQAYADGVRDGWVRAFVRFARSDLPWAALWPRSDVRRDLLATLTPLVGAERAVVMADNTNADGDSRE